MSTSFRPYHPDQSLLLPPSPRDWLSEDHLAFFVSDTVDSLDLSGFYERYEGDGRRNQPFDPRMMVKLLVYGYATGVFSSRKIALKLHEDVAFRVLAAGNAPAHRTIAEFRQRHLGEFASLFVQVVRMARELGLIKLGTIAIDGSKVKANASKRKAMSYGRMVQEEKRLKREIRAILRRAKKTDDHEDALFGPDFRGDELPEELTRRESRLEQIRAAKQRLEARQEEEDRAKGRNKKDDDDKPGKPGPKFKRQFGKPPDKAQENFTDPDSRIMKDSKGFEQSYNSQVAVDAEAQLIVAVGVTQQAADNGELQPMIEQVESNTGDRPERVLADAGYRSEENFLALEDQGIEGYVALGRKGGKEASEFREDHVATRRMARKLKSQRGKARYRQRKWIAEPVFGWIKSCLGFRSFSLRGHEKVSAEWNLVSLAVNLRRMSERVAWT
jgi:transposase